MPDLTREQIIELAQQAGAVSYTPAPMRAVRGMSFRYEQMEAFAQMIAARTQPAEQQPVAWPTTPDEVRVFVGSNLCSLRWHESKDRPHESDLYELTAHDLIEAFDTWVSVPPGMCPYPGDGRRRAGDCIAAGTCGCDEKDKHPPAALVREIKKLTRWKHCMSYNDSYFGEPAGLVKAVAYELERLLDRASPVAAPAEQQPIPEGWRLVPVEPTSEMIAAMQSGGWLPGCYRAMLDAAPQPPAAASSAQPDPPRCPHVRGDSASQWCELAESSVRERDAELAALREALEECRLLAGRHRREEWAQHILRFCEAAGATGSPLRTTDAALTNAARDVLAERQRQQSAEGWTPEHDDEHANGELALAAACYALCSARPEPEWVRPPSHRTPPKYWPWQRGWWKPRGPRHDLVRAGALILAEIERLDRAALAQGKEADHGRD